MKWKQASAKYRKDIARALTAATPVMLMKPAADQMMRVFAGRCCGGDSTPTALDQATGRLDGKNAAVSTARRHRTILANAMDYAVELGHLETNPIRVLKWTAPKVSSQVDRRSVVDRARREDCWTQCTQPSGPLLVAFFSVMYYAGLRPEEAISPYKDNLILPPQVWDEERQEWQCAAASCPRSPTGAPGSTRQVALTAAEQASPLARRPYDLRHACLSTWPNGGLYPTQVAEWGGHGVDVLLRIYAKCVVGQDELAKRRISEALRQD